MSRFKSPLTKVESPTWAIFHSYTYTAVDCKTKQKWNQGRTLKSEEHHTNLEHVLHHPIETHKKICEKVTEGTCRDSRKLVLTLIPFLISAWLMSVLSQVIVSLKKLWSRIVTFKWQLILLVCRQRVIIVLREKLIKHNNVPAFFFMQSRTKVTFQQSEIVSSNPVHFLLVLFLFLFLPQLFKFVRNCLRFCKQNKQKVESISVLHVSKTKVANTLQSCFREIRIAFWVLYLVQQCDPRQWIAKSTSSLPWHYFRHKQEKNRNKAPSDNILGTKCVCVLIQHQKLTISLWNIHTHTLVINFTLGFSTRRCSPVFLFPLRWNTKTCERNPEKVPWRNEHPRGLIWFLGPYLKCKMCF